ncbi:hypothetical protein ACER0C_022319 [Sarotherodon galilaeus]
MLDSSSRAELRLWQLLLANWNGITFFYNDQLSHPNGVQLFTDATPSPGFGGYYSRRHSEPWRPTQRQLRPQLKYSDYFLARTLEAMFLLAFFGFYAVPNSPPHPRSSIRFFTRV